MSEKNFYYSSQGDLFGKPEAIGFGSNDFNVCVIDRNIANQIIIKNHYSKKIYTATYIHLGVFSGGVLMGVLQLGYAMNPASQESVVSDTGIKEYLELNRMWLDDKLPKNTASRAMSYAIKYIKKRYPKIKWIQSFADERCKAGGIVYQACNYRYYGEHLSTFWELDGVVYHNSLMTRDPSLSKSAAVIQDGKYRATESEYRQFRYIYFIWPKWANNCLLDEKPYPKIQREATE